MSRRRRFDAKPPPGIEVRHAASCPAGTGGECACDPSYRAIVRTPGGGKLQQSFPTLQAAVMWREDARVDVRRGVLDAPKPLTVRQAADAWLAGAKRGTVRNRSGHVYKPSSIRGYDQALRDYVVPDLGAMKLSELRRADVQALADRLLADGLEASTVRNALMPLRAICRRALVRGDVTVNPTLGLELPASDGHRDRIATPEEALLLLAALPERDRALWATALYAGLRRSELRALRCSDIDLERRVIRVARSWDQVEGVIEPKSKAGLRVVPIPSVLYERLTAHQLGVGDELAFARASGRPFEPKSVGDRAQRHWKDAGLNPITLHECRHTFASLMIAAGVNLKALQTFMGHASITITLDRYGHLLPGSEVEAAGLLDAFLQSRVTLQRPVVSGFGTPGRVAAQSTEAPAGGDAARPGDSWTP